MNNFIVEDIKKYMNELLFDTKYDSFYLYEARVKSSLDYYICGKINHDFFKDDDTDLLENHDITQEYIYWKDIKSSLFDIIKGKRLPISFKFILMFNNENIKKLIEMNNLPIAPENVSALFYNVYYENKTLQVTTGSSVKVFTLDKSLDNLWDDTVSKYYI